MRDPWSTLSPFPADRASSELLHNSGAPAQAPCHVPQRTRWAKAPSPSANVSFPSPLGETRRRERPLQVLPSPHHSEEAAIQR